MFKLHCDNFKKKNIVRAKLKIYLVNQPFLTARRGKNINCAVLILKRENNNKRLSVYICTERIY